MSGDAHRGAEAGMVPRLSPPVTHSNPLLSVPLTSFSVLPEISVLEVARFVPGACKLDNDSTEMEAETFPWLFQTHHASESASRKGVTGWARPLTMMAKRRLDHTVERRETTLGGQETP